jgi:hypothetical protein
LTLGVSGYLYRNAVLYYDSETETFWSQMTGKAVVGPQTGKALPWMPSEVTTWADWRKRHPATTVIKPPFPMRAYESDPYARYRRTQRRTFPDAPGELPGPYKAKDDVTIVVLRDGKARCYPHPALREGKTKDGDRRVVKNGVTVKVYGKDGKEIPSLYGYWFAFWAFYPDGTVYERPAK